MSQNEMMKVRREILTAVNKNKEREKKDAIYSEMLTNALTSAAAIEHAKKTTDHMDNILDIRFPYFFSFTLYPTYNRIGREPDVKITHSIFNSPLYFLFSWWNSM